MKILKGSSIIEVVIATALISIAILSALSLTNNSQKTNDSARNVEEANKYATQATDCYDQNAIHLAGQPWQPKLPELIV